jgi:hypothetical protein
LKKAVQRVHCTERSIQQWTNEDGMQFVWKGGRKMIRLDDLLLHSRANLKATRAGRSSTRWSRTRCVAPARPRVLALTHADPCSHAARAHNLPTLLGGGP